MILLFYVPYFPYRGLNKERRRLSDKKGRRNRTYDTVNLTGLEGIEIFMVLLDFRCLGIIGGNKNVYSFPMSWSGIDNTVTQCNVSKDLHPNKTTMCENCWTLT
jgi:hypothetical protein